MNGEERGLLGNLPRSRPGTRSEKRDGRRGRARRAGATPAPRARRPSDPVGRARLRAAGDGPPRPALRTAGRRDPRDPPTPAPALDLRARPGRRAPPRARGGRRRTSTGRPTRTTSPGCRGWSPTTCCCRSSRWRCSRCSSPGRVLESGDLEQSVLQDLQQLLPDRHRRRRSPARSTGCASSSTGFGVVALVASIWIGSSFWGALDTAFCRIYHVRCRSWLEQKRFALVMLVVVLLFMAATVAVPTVQSLLRLQRRRPAARAVGGRRAGLRGHAGRRPAAPVR